MTSDRTVKAAAIQWDIELGKVEANVGRAAEFVEAAARDGVSLTVLPELWASSFMGEDARRVRSAIETAEKRIRELSGDLDLIVVGSNYEFAPDGGAYNRARVLERGKLLGEYRKMHLFSPQGEDRYFRNGTSALVAETRIGLLGVAICYDLRFPELIRHLYCQGAELLVLPAQWPEPREGHWRLLCRARAVENQWFVVAANRCGVEPSIVNGQDVVYPGNSIIVDPTGAVMAEGNGTPAVVTAELELKATAIVRRAIPVGKDRQPETYQRL